MRLIWLGIWIGLGMVLRMGLIKKIKELENSMNVNNNRKGYKFNKWVFNIMILLMILSILFVWAEYDFVDIKQPHLLYECEEPNFQCRNDLYSYCNPQGKFYYRQDSICNSLDSSMYEKEFLFGGESIGQRPSFLTKNISQLFIIIIVGAFLFNHLLFNWRGRKNGR